MRKTKNSYFSNLDTKKITDNRTFWKTIVPLFTNKPSKSENIIINDGDKRISDEKKLWQIFNTFFSNVVQLRYPSNYFNDILFHSLSAIIEHFEKHRVSLISRINEKKFHSLSAIIEHFEKHRSVTNIKNKNFESTFSLKKTTPEEVVKGYPQFKPRMLEGLAKLSNIFI